MSETNNQLEQVKSLDSKLEIMDIATELRKSGNAAKQNLDIHLIKNDIKKTLLETAKIRGENLTEEQVDTAIDTKISEMYKFKKPQKGLKTDIAYAFADRKRLGKKYGIPTAWIAGLGVAAYTAIQLISYSVIKGHEHDVENAVLENFTKRKNVEISINEVHNAKTNFVNDKELELIVDDVKFKLMNSKEFFDNYCPKGDPSDVITTENYESVNNKLSTITKTINEAENKTLNGQKLIILDRNLVSTKEGLDVIIAEVRNIDTAEKLKLKAESDYMNGVVSVKGLDINRAIRYKNNLEELKQDIKIFSTLPTQLEQAYSGIKSISKDPKANFEADQLYSEAKVEINEVNITQLKNTIQEMKSIDNILRQEYTIKIVSREGVKSGIDRYYTDERGKRASGFYLIVEAIDPKGNILRKKVVNEENNRVESVSIWGERVPEAVYERLKSDKLDNGIINDNIFGAKKKGYLEDIIIMKDTYGKTLKRVGQITEW